MKPILIIIIPLALFIGFGLFAEHYIYSSASEITNQIEELQAQVNNEDWTKASKTIGHISDNWTRTRKRWNIYIDHMEVDRIDTSFTKVEKWIELEEKKDCLVELAALKQTILHIPENEKLMIPNIL
ncbi:MAG TPA: DUF4363 family protein [Bacillota bacterium]|nr:DUF4363 family protein [Bacillota bacterium]